MWYDASISDEGVFLMHTVVVLGASDNPDRKSNEAVKLLAQKGCRVIPVHPTLDVIEGIPVANTLSTVPEEPDVLTIYVNSDRSGGMRDDIVRLAPRTVIFNPGSENPDLETYLTGNGIHVVRACTIVLLKTGQFEKTIS